MIFDQQDGEFQDTRSFGVISPDTAAAHCNVVEKIGAGGMGEIYLAEDTKLNRKVALKFLLGWPSSRPGTSLGLTRSKGGQNAKSGAFRDSGR